MESTTGDKVPNRRPGGRTANVTERVNRAVLDLLIEGGAQACTVNNVAERAGVERSTLYRRYADRWAMIIDAMVAKGGADVAPVDRGSLAQDLKTVLRKLVDVLETPLGPALLAGAAELRSAEGAVHTRHYFDKRMEQLEPMFHKAIERGELPGDVDKEYVFSFAAGPIYFRMFIAARKIDDHFIDAIVDATCRHFAVPTSHS